MIEKEKLREKLKNYFGYDSFRQGQENIILNILKGKDVLGILPTGGGKSICYQLPALIMDGICLVISPLISLMKDQVESLIENGISAGYINSSMTSKEYSQSLSKLAKGDIKILYISPERFENQFFLELIQSLNISFIAIDEAHCISQWGHDFRPSYKLIANVYELFGKKMQLAAFTATATKEVREDIVKNLKLKDPYIKVTGFDRKNLFFQVNKPKDKLSFIKNYLNKHLDQSGIIYASTRKKVEEIYKYLKNKNISVAKYHAGMDDEEKNTSQEDFIYDRKNIIVATNAFGMGIDKSDVRFVIHYNMPKDMESYYQEAGRAGRDGEKSDAILLFSGQDIVINKFLIKQSGNYDYQKVKLKKLQTIINYANTSRCLRHFIISYFGQDFKEECKNCSNCLSEVKKDDVTLDAQKVLSCIYRLKQRYGASTITDCLKGSRSKSSKQKKLDQVSTFAIMKEKSSKYIRDLIGNLVADGYILVSGGEYPILKLSEKSKEVLFDKKKVYVNHIEDEDKVSLEKKENSSYKEARTDLFNHLKKIRLQLSKEKNIPPFIIFNDASLKDMASKKPKTKEEFILIKGVGEKKLSQYGDIFIKEIKNMLR